MLDQFPNTLFQVEVLEVLKGSLSGVVKVVQAAGVDEDGSMFFMAGDTQLLETGKVYFLAVRGPALESNGGGYRVVSGGNGMHEVEILEGTGEPPGPTGNTGSEGILSSRQTDELRTRFADAIANEVPFDFGD